LGDELEEEQETEVRTAPDKSVSERLSTLSKEEKLLILVGIFLFYGTRKVTQKKIQALKALVHHLEFDSDAIAHRDPSDTELCLAETTAWVLNVLRTNFADQSALPDEDVEPLIRSVMRSLDKDLKREDAPEEKAVRIIEGLERLASLDGAASSNETHLIKALKSESRFITGNSWRIFGGVVMCGAIGVSFAALEDGSAIFALLVFVAICLSATKWIAQLFSRALI
jgi:hypothetical protein